MTLERIGRGFDFQAIGPGGQSPRRVPASSNSSNSSRDRDRDQAKQGPPTPSANGWIVFANNIHEEASEEDTKEHFGDYDVSDLTANLDRCTGFIKGYALLVFKSRDEA